MGVFIFELKDMLPRYPLKKLFLIWFCSFYILSGKPLCAPNTFRSQNNEVVFVYYEESLRSAVKDSMILYSEVKRDLEKMIRWSIDFNPTIILISDADTFQGITGNDYIVGLAQPERDLIVIDYSKIKTGPFSMEGIIKHELCHLLLHKHIDQTNLPKWLDEGIAQWVSGGMADIVMGRKRDALNRLNLSRDYISIRSLERYFPSDWKSLTLAYAESKSIVEYIIKAYGVSNILIILENLRDDYNMDAAVFKSLSISYDELEKEWLNTVNKKISLFYFIITYLYEIIFFMGAIILVYGFIRLYIKKRSYDRDGGDGYGSDL